MASSNPRDFVKRKKANRLSKLKQCKLDARREQWLSQVKDKKGAKEEISYGVPRSQGPAAHSENEICRPLPKLEMKPKIHDKDMNNYSDSESFASNSPTSHNGNHDSEVNFNASVSGSHNSEIDPMILTSQYTGMAASIGNGSCSGRSSSSSSSGFYVGNVSEGDGGDDDCLDDWEAMADALGVSDNKQQVCCPNAEVCAPDKDDDIAAARSVPQVDQTNSEVNNSNAIHILGGAANKRAIENCRAWRSDDAFRPRSLPNLSKQYSSLSMNSGRSNTRQPVYTHKNVSPEATACPICFEDFDCTDANFLPCPCGFRICLFCHKRILEEDGRCPGCRKPYERKLVIGEAALTGGCLRFQVARTWSMVSRC